MSGPRRRSVEPPLIAPQAEKRTELGTLPRNRLGRLEDNSGSNRGRGRRGMGPRGLLALLVGALAVLIVIFVLLPGLAGGLLRSLADSNPDLIRLPMVADAVREELGNRLDQPGGTDPTPVDFEVAHGTSSRDITDELVSRGLVTDRLAFTFYLIDSGVVNRLQAGTHVLNRTMSPRQVGDTLAQPPAPPAATVTIALRTGLRIEQIVAYLEDHKEDLAFDPNDFLNLATNPPADLVAQYPMLQTKPAGRSLEGYLGSGVIVMPKDTDARGLLELLLQHREAEFDPLINSPSIALPSTLDNFYDALILASIVDHEAKLDSDKPLIAGVYVNRLAGLANGVRLLNSEPTVVYANDTVKLREMPLFSWPSYVFWGLTGFADLGDVAVPQDLASFQTWHSLGLPDWPIASPSLSSLQAALNPDTADGYLYFFAKCDGSGSHWFEKTLAEHQQHVVQCANGGGASASPTDTPVASP